MLSSTPHYHTYIQGFKVIVGYICELFIEVLVFLKKLIKIGTPASMGFFSLIRLPLFLNNNENDLDNFFLVKLQIYSLNIKTIFMNSQMFSSSSIDLTLCRTAVFTLVCDWTHFSFDTCWERLWTPVEPSNRALTLRGLSSAAWPTQRHESYGGQLRSNEMRWEQAVHLQCRIVFLESHSSPEIILLWCVYKAHLLSWLFIEKHVWWNSLTHTHTHTRVQARAITSSDYTGIVLER